MHAPCCRLSKNMSAEKREGGGHLCASAHFGPLYSHYLLYLLSLPQTAPCLNYPTPSHLAPTSVRFGCQTIGSHCCRNAGQQCELFLSYSCRCVCMNKRMYVYASIYIYDLGTKLKRARQGWKARQGFKGQTMCVCVCVCDRLVTFKHIAQSPCHLP